MIDHMSIAVSDFQKSKQFYTKALAPIGYSLLMEVTKEQSSHHDAAAFGEPPKPDFWIAAVASNAPPPVHVAFAVASRAQVHDFYAAAMAAGGSDNGAPGLRPYQPNYYAAFVRDPDGHNIEAVCHAPE